MRFLCCLGCCCLGFVGACTDSNAAALPGEGRLVLELGGPHASLRHALQTAGVTVGSPQHLRGEEPASPPEDGPPRVDPNDEPVPAPTPAPSPSPETEPFVYVTLAPGQTLIHLARKHLGDGNRFREILAINGWTEADSRRLQAGQRVKIPRAGGTRPAAR